MTSTEARSSWSNRLSPRNWSLAWKLVAVGLVPALLAVVLGVLRVADQAETASELGAANRLLQIRTSVADAAAALRTERDRATVFLAERRLGDRGPLNDAESRTDAAIERIRTGIGDAGLDPATRAAHERSDGGLAQLAVLRGGVTGSAPLLPAQVLQRYTTVIDRVDGFDRALLRQVRTPEIAGLTDAMSAVTAASEALALQHTVLGVSLRTGAVTPADAATVGVTDGSYVTAFSDYQLALPTSMQPINFVTSENNAQRDAAKSAIILSPTPGPIPITPAAWDESVARATADVEQAGSQVGAALTEAGEVAEARSSNLAGVNSVLLMLGLLLAATIVVLVARSLTRSLRVLRTSALDVAQRRLPQAVESMRAGNAPDVTVEPVPLTNRDEVGQVARAFDAVHGQALRLAADQAALQSNVSSMFVNLSRRSQGLVERQLQLIEQLESNEQDPDQLSNLFQLDHLATRMRRNSENLLVLAGTDFAKRNVAPVPLVDVLRAAVSEIEHYQRITVQAPPQATIIGRATSDVVHLLAELLDNATNFSPPDSHVVMSSMRTPDGSILVEIADRGVGMLDQELSDANRRLTTPSAVDVSASRRMGLFVVGRLGTRHGITVHLGGAPMGGPGGGLTASVTLPAHLVVSVGDDSRPMRPEPAPAALGAPNGVPPQRADQPGRSIPRTALAPASNGASLPQPTGLNGLPTRTPGSALRRNSAITGFGAPEARQAHDPGGPAVGERRMATSTESAAATSDADAAEENADVVPTGTMPAVGAVAAGATTAGPTGRDETDRDETGDEADTPSSGERADRRPGRPQAYVRPGSPRDAPNGGGSPRTDQPQTDQPQTDRPRTDRPQTDRGAAEQARGPRTGPAGSTRGGASAPGALTPGALTPGALTPGALTPGALTPGAFAPGPDGPDRRASPPVDAPREAVADSPAAIDGADTAPESTAAEGPGGPDLMGSDDTAGVARADAAGQDARPDGESSGLAPDALTRVDDRADGRSDDRSAGVDAAPHGAGGGATPDRADNGDVDDGDDGDDGDGAAEAGTAGDVAAVTPRRTPPRPRPYPATGPNGTYRDLTVPATPYEASDSGAIPAGVGQNGTGPNGDGGYGDSSYRDGGYGDSGYGEGSYRDGAGDGSYGDGRYTDLNGGISPPTTPLPVVPGLDAAGASGPIPVPVGSGPGENGADALFSASVPAISEPDGLPRSRRPLSDLRRGEPADITETTPIFEEIASAWFASQRPVPVDWELGRRPGAAPEADAAPPPRPRPGPVRTDPRGVPATPAGRPGPAVEPAAFASAADEGWRAANGAAADRPDELTAAGLPKRRPRARLVPGSAGSAVLAAPASPTRSAENIRGRLASYQQGVRQGREIRLRRDPGGAGPQPASTDEDTAVPTSGEHDEETR